MSDFYVSVIKHEPLDRAPYVSTVLHLEGPYGEKISDTFVSDDLTPESVGRAVMEAFRCAEREVVG